MHSEVFLSVHQYKRQQHNNHGLILFAFPGVIQFHIWAFYREEELKYQYISTIHLNYDKQSGAIFGFLLIP